MFTSVFLIYLSMASISMPVWNALFWLMVLFNTMNTIAKGFLQESEGKMLYYHSLCKPEALIFSKIIFNSLVSLLLLLVFSMAYSLVLGFKIEFPVQYLLVSVLFTIGLSTVSWMPFSGAHTSAGAARIWVMTSLSLVLERPTPRLRSWWRRCRALVRLPLWATPRGP